MARITYSRAFDISRQFVFGNWTEAALSATAIATATATATALTLELNGARIVLGGNFTLAGTAPTAGSITSLTYYTVANAPVTEFAVTGFSMSYGNFINAMADNDFNAVAGNGMTWVSGSAGNDRLYGGAGNDKLEGLAGNDSLFGSAGNDTLDGGLGNDSMQGGSGNDIYIVDSLQDKVVEAAGAGVDSVRTILSSYTLGANIDNLRFTGVANAVGTGNELSNLLAGSRGNDSLNGSDGHDTLCGGLGADTLMGGNGNDLLVGDPGGNTAPSIASSLQGAQPLSVSLAVGDVSAASSTTVSGYISLSSQEKGNFNLAVVLDTTNNSNDSTGAPVNDLNGDGVWNQKLDAQIAAFKTLISTLQAAGLGDKVRVALMGGGGGSFINAIAVPNADLNGNGVSDLVDAAQALQTNGSFYPATAFTSAAQFFEQSPSAENIMLYVGAFGSVTDSSSYNASYQRLTDPAGINATIRTLSFRSSEAYNTMDLLDNRLLDHSALSVNTPAELTSGLLASRVNTSDISRLEVYKNGVLLATLNPSQLTDTPLGLRYSVPVSGLNPTGMDEIETRLIFKNAAPSISVSQQIGGGNQVFNDSLVGGAGDDTLVGSVGTDTLAGGLGNDVYRLSNNSPVVQELPGQGVDAIEIPHGFSLEASAYQNIENLKLLGLGNFNATGNVRDNIIEGNSGNNVLKGQGGNDTLIGGRGFDIVDYTYAQQGMAVSLSVGQALNVSALDLTQATVTEKPPGSVVIVERDHLSEFEGIWGSAFGDWLYGSDADDILRGNGGDDTIFGGIGFDTVDYSTATAGMTVTLWYTTIPIDTPGWYGEARCANGSQGFDLLDTDIEGVIGSAYADNISSSHVFEDCKLQGGDGDDTLTGGTGDDTLLGGTGRNVIVGGNGWDWTDYSAATAAVSGSLVTGRLSIGSTGANVDTISQVEKFILSAYADSIVGSEYSEYFDGGAGNDTLIGGAGHDTLRGGTGADSMAGGAGDDIYYVDFAGDVVTESASAGTDTVYVSVAAGAFTRTFNGVETIHLAGNAAFNVSGGDESNNISGTEGNDTINGGSGIDHDALSGGGGIDWLSYADHKTGVFGTLSSGYGGPRYGIDGDTVYGFANFLGSAFADDVQGDDGANILSGGAGNDKLDGLLGDDTLLGGAGNDVLDGGYGFDTASYASLAGPVRIELSTGIAVSASEGTDTLTGIETIIGGAGNDVIAWTSSFTIDMTAVGYRLDSGAGNDSLTGGAGDDTLVGGAGDDVLDGGPTVYGYGLADVVDYGSATAAVVVDLAAGTATGGAGNDRLIGIERVVGSGFADKLTGKARPESEYFWGGAGADTLDGGADNSADYFCYARVSDSTATAMDTIKYRAGDVINLQAIEADGPGMGDGGFAFRGTSQFSGGTGELRYAVIGSDTYIYADVDGNRVVDMTIKLAGAFTLTAANFWL